MVSSRFCRRSSTFCTVLFLWDSGSAERQGGGFKGMNGSCAPLPVAVPTSSCSARCDRTGQGWHRAGAAPPQNATLKGAATETGMSGPERTSWGGPSGATRPRQVTRGQLQSHNPEAPEVTVLHGTTQKQPSWENMPKPVPVSPRPWGALA